MLGKNLYRIEKCAELSNDEVKSLSLFYRPLIGAHAYALYMHMVYMTIDLSFEPLNDLCVVLNISIDRLEKALELLNKYKLLKTYKKEDIDEYIFVLIKPLGMHEFVKNSVFVRNFILKCSGPLYQKIMTGVENNAISKKGYKDISLKLDADILDSWSEENETYIANKNDETVYRINSLFDINSFLKDISENLFPKKYRTLDNLKAISEMADLYNVTASKMRTYIPKIIRSDSDEFDMKMLKNLCMYSQSEYREVDKGSYSVPCVLFLMNLQDGKEVTENDRKILLKLSESYYLSPEVINTLIECHLKEYDNRIIEKILYSQASDLHRNNVNTHEKALERLNKKTKPSQKTDKAPEYHKEDNGDIDLSNLESFLKKRD